MQTFLPVVIDHSGPLSCVRSAKVLDRQRLGKQRVEALQIYRVLSGKSTGWRHHPAVRMWEGYTDALMLYGRVMCFEWGARGYKDNCLNQFVPWPPKNDVVWPDWMWDPAFAASHRSNLLRKNPEWYGKFGWTEPTDLPYVWPVKHR